MEIKVRILYEAPVAIPVEVKIEGYLCQSDLSGLDDPDDYILGDDPFLF